MGALPVEFTILGFEPRVWSIEDTIVIGLHMYRDLTTSWKSDLSRAAILAGGDKQLAPQLFPARTGFELPPGSNAGVRAGGRTATGKPLLANDPHLEWALPSTWYMVHLQAPGLNVEGVS